METNIEEISLEELVKKVIEANSVIEEMEAAVSEVKNTILSRLNKMRVDGLKVSNYLIKKNVRVSFPDVQLSEAKELGAVKETIDQEKLKALYKKGIKIKTRVTQYITVKEATS